MALNNELQYRNETGYCYLNERINGASVAFILYKNFVKFGLVTPELRHGQKTGAFSRISQDILDQFSRFFHQTEGICVTVYNPVQFLKFLKGRCHGNQFVSYRTCSLRVSQDPLDQFAQSLHHIVDIKLQMINPTFFFDTLRDIAMATNYVAKLWQNYLQPYTCR